MRHIFNGGVVAGYIEKISNVSEEARTLLASAYDLERDGVDAWARDDKPAEYVIALLKGAVKGKFIEAKIIAILENDSHAYVAAKKGMDNAQSIAGSIVEDLAVTDMDREKARRLAFREKRPADRRS